MSNSIRLSKKYGVNPSICKCFFCGSDKGIALMGKLGGRNEDLEAPKSCIMDYEPCDTCQTNMAQGVTLIEVTNVQPQDMRPALNAQNNQKVYPLGGWCVIKPEAFSRMTNQEWSAGQKCFVDSKVLQMIVGGAQS